MPYVSAVVVVGAPLTSIESTSVPSLLKTESLPVVPSVGATLKVICNVVSACAAVAPLAGKAAANEIAAGLAATVVDVLQAASVAEPDAQVVAPAPVGCTSLASVPVVVVVPENVTVAEAPAARPPGSCRSAC